MENVRRPNFASSQVTIGQKLEKELYWEFKKAAATRRETMADAVSTAVQLYIDLAEMEVNDI